MWCVDGPERRKPCSVPQWHASNNTAANTANHRACNFKGRVRWSSIGKQQRMQNNTMNHCWNDELSKMSSLTICKPNSYKIGVQLSSTVCRDSLTGLECCLLGWHPLTTSWIIELGCLGVGYIYWCSFAKLPEYCLARYNQSNDSTVLD